MSPGLHLAFGLMVDVLSPDMIFGVNCGLNMMTLMGCHPFLGVKSWHVSHISRSVSQADGVPREKTLG